MKQLTLLLCLISLIGCLSGCQMPEKLIQKLPQPTQPPLAMRMVKQVEVSLQPEPESYCRIYKMQESLNPLIHLLREIDYGQPIRDDEALERSRSYFSFTICYSSGERQNYRLLAHQYLRIEGEGWFEIDLPDALALTDFLAEHESDTGFIPTPKPVQPVPYPEAEK